MSGPVTIDSTFRVLSEVLRVPKVVEIFETLLLIGAIGIFAGLSVFGAFTVFRALGVSGLLPDSLGRILWTPWTPWTP